MDYWKEKDFQSEINWEGTVVGKSTLSVRRMCGNSGVNHITSRLTDFQDKAKT